jgi:3-oxoacyl-[acyl-carrier-protein] synthase-1
MLACQVQLTPPVQGVRKLVKMAAMAIQECLEGSPRASWSELPLLLCVAERDRPGRLSELDSTILTELQNVLGATFATESKVIEHGRVGVAVALAHAGRLVHEQGKPQVLIVATDSLLSSLALFAYQKALRLRNSRNSNGFMAGEAAGAVLVSGQQSSGDVLCMGVGFGVEKAHIDSDLPMRADGLCHAISQVLIETRVTIDQCPIRLSDLSGEHYYFREAALAVARLQRKDAGEGADLWHPAECIGECGAAAGISLIAVATAGFKKGYLPGAFALAHMSNDKGERAVVLMHQEGRG